MNSETRNDTSNTKSMIKDVVDDPLQIPESFIQENLAKSGQKRPGPRTKAERTKRRKEVYRLFFHEGLTATEISEAMKVSRTTINADLQLCYREADKELSIPYEEYYNRQELRIETQRRRLVGYLKEAREIHTKLAIERQIGDLDFKLLNMREQIEHGMFKFHDELRTCVNDILDALGADYRVTSLFEKVRIPVEGRKAIDRAWAQRYPEKRKRK